jgi:hypothetical protein
MEMAKLCILREQPFQIFYHIHCFARSKLVMLATLRLPCIYSQIRQAMTEAALWLGISRILCDHNLCDNQHDHNPQQLLSNKSTF